MPAIYLLDWPPDLENGVGRFDLHEGWRERDNIAPVRLDEKQHVTFVSDDYLAALGLTGRSQ